MGLSHKEYLEGKLNELQKLKMQLLLKKDIRNEEVKKKKVPEQKKNNLLNIYIINKFYIN